MILLSRAHVHAGPPRVRYAPPTAPTDRVPSLVSLCLLRLAEFPDAVHPLPVRLCYADAPPDVPGPWSWSSGPWPVPDPRLWATLAQVYDGLPASWRSYALPLADQHVPLLQRIPHTPRFSLLTLLDLPGCPHLTDASIHALRKLHSLVALDASATTLTAYAINALAGTMVADGTHRRGPWPLRVLRLRYCRHIDDDVYHHLAKFPLLSVVDLRGTDCRPPTMHTLLRPSSDPALFHPAPLAAAVDALYSNGVYSSPNTCSLVIATLHHPPSTAPTSIFVPQESYVFVPSQSATPKPTSDYNLQLPRRRIQPPKYPAHYAPERTDNGSLPGLDSRKYGDPQSDELIFEPLPTAGPLNLPRLPTLDDNLPTPARAHSSPPQPRSAEAAPDTFYRTIPPLDPRRKYDPINDYAAEMYYARVPIEGSTRPTSRHDAKLTLYRTPPPWSVLEEWTAALARDRTEVKAKPSGMITAEVNRSRMAMGKGVVNQRRLDGLKESASARKQSAVGATPGQATPAPASVTSTIGSASGRNPFRRSSTGTPGAGPSGSARAAKPLIPISAMAVPVLPVPKTPAPSASRIKSKGLVASSFSEDVKSKVGSEKNILTPRLNSNKRPMFDEGGSASVKKKKGVNNNPKTIYAESSKAKGFDWGVWGGEEANPKDTKNR